MLAFGEVAPEGGDCRPDGKTHEAEGDPLRHGGRADGRIADDVAETVDVPEDQRGEAGEHEGDDKRRPVGAACFCR